MQAVEDQTVDLLGRFHIYTILDMHQDVYNEMFDGEGAPKWAVCTNGVPSVDPPGRWSLEYATKAAGIAFHHFWDNDVRGDLQGEYDRVWGDVAHGLQGEPVGPRLRPLQRAVLDVADPLRRRALRRPARVLLHRHGPGRQPLARSASAAVPEARSRRGRGADHPGQRPLPSDLRRARQLREPRLSRPTWARWTCPTSSSTSTSTAGPGAR